MQNATLSQINKCQICEDHFLEEDYSQTSSRRTLNKNRFPSVNMHPAPVIDNPEEVERLPSEVRQSPLGIDLLQEAMSAWQIESDNVGDSSAPGGSAQLSEAETGILLRRKIAELSAQLRKEKSHSKYTQKKMKQAQQNYCRTCKKLIALKNEMKLSGLSNLKRLNTSESIFVGMQLNKIGVKPKVIWINEEVIIVLQ